jgi:hypothetical protein
MIPIQHNETVRGKAGEKHTGEKHTGENRPLPRATCVSEETTPCMRKTVQQAVVVTLGVECTRAQL